MDNLQIACMQVAQYDGILLRDSEKGELWYLEGVLIAPDDLYYQVIKVPSRERRLLSFVGDIEESYKFVPVIK